MAGSPNKTMSTNRFSQPVTAHSQYRERLCICGCGHIAQVAFASAACRHNYRLRTDGNYLRECVFARDAGRCATCNRDTEVLRRLCKTLPRRDRKTFARSVGVPGHRVNGAWWDADHIKPVIQGGGEAGIDNLQTLCCECHTKKTARLATQRKMARQLRTRAPRVELMEDL